MVSVSWYPPGLSDDEGPPPDPVIPVLLNAALAHGFKITLHIEPYKGRTPQSVRDNLMYIHSHYTQCPDFYELEHVNSSENDEKRLLPVIYIYDSYLSPASEWATVFRPDGALSVRGREYDCVAIALLVEHGHIQFAVDGGFDGINTYFAANGLVSVPLLAIETPFQNSLTEMVYCLFLVLDQVTTIFRCCHGTK